MNLIKRQDGSYLPVYESDFLESKKVKVGSEVRATRSRNPMFHRKAFALLNLGFSNQDKFDEFEIYRMTITMKAGFVHWVEGTDGQKHPLPHSLSFDKMNQDEFEKWYGAVLEIISKETATAKIDIENELSSFF